MESVKEGHRSGSYDDKKDQTYPSNEIIKTKGAQPSFVLSPMTTLGGQYYKGTLSTYDPILNITITSSLPGVEFVYDNLSGLSSSSIIPLNITSFNLFIQTVYNGPIIQTFTLNVQNPFTDLRFMSDALKANIDNIGRFTQIMQQAATAMLADGIYSDADFKEQTQRLALGQKIDPAFQMRLYDVATVLDTTISIGGAVYLYKQTLDRIRESGTALTFLTVRMAAQNLKIPAPLIKAAGEALDQLAITGINVDEVITQGATQLANFLIDGTYNFTFILFPSPSQPNGAVGTGTAAIDSEYDGYTHGLAQKIINQNITTPFSMNILQTLDISYNSILIDTYGTSNTGKYTIEGNILTIYSYGYSNGTIFFGEFINDIVKIIKTDIGYIVQHNKINPDNSIGPLIDVVYYVRQLTIPDEDAKKFEQLFQTRDKDGDGFIDRLTAQGLVDGALFTTSKIALPTNVSAYIGPALLGYILCYVGPT